MEESQIVAHRAQDTCPGPAGVNLYLVYILNFVKQLWVGQAYVYSKVEMLPHPKICEGFSSKIFHKFSSEWISRGRCPGTLSVNFNQENWLIELLWFGILRILGRAQGLSQQLSQKQSLYKNSHFYPNFSKRN